MNFQFYQIYGNTAQNFGYILPSADEALPFNIVEAVFPELRPSLPF